MKTKKNHKDSQTRESSNQNKPDSPSFGNPTQEIDPGLDMNDWNEVGNIINEIRHDPARCGQIASSPPEKTDHSVASDMPKDIDDPNEFWDLTKQPIGNNGVNAVKNKTPHSDDEKMKKLRNTLDTADVWRADFSCDFLEKLLGRLYEHALAQNIRRRTNRF